MIESFHLDPELHRLTWQYGIGVLLPMPFGLVSTVGTYQLQITGKMQYLMGLSIMEGIVNAVLDLFFTGALHHGSGFPTCVRKLSCSA